MLGLYESLHGHSPSPVANLKHRTTAMVLNAVAVLACAVAPVGCANVGHSCGGSDTLRLLDSERKEQLIGKDAQGKLKFSEYEGKRVVVIGTLVHVRLPGHSPSISVEDASACFELHANQVIPAAPDCRFVELRFDEHGVLESFVEGESWEITLTESGELVRLAPVPLEAKSGGSSRN